MSNLHIDLESIANRVRNRRNELNKQALEEQEQKYLKKEMAVKTEITNIIEKDAIKQIELEEKQNKLKKYYEIVTEEERQKRLKEEKEKFKLQCQSMVDYENSYVKRYVFKFCVWGFVAYVTYYYVKSFF
jgi:hypothetical protein